jgi:hypothetical protein
MWVDPVDLAVWHFVEYNGDRYILVATNLDDELYKNTAVSILQSDPIGELLLQALPYDERMALVTESTERLKAELPAHDTAVFRGDKDWGIVGECGPECSEGICTRRVASNETVGDIELAYKMLIDFLNA